MPSINQPCPVFSRQTRLCRVLRKSWLLAGLCSLQVPASATLDSDGNSLSDVWQRKFKVGAIPASGDLDGDGFANFHEFLFGTDPTDSRSRPETSCAMPAPGLLHASWPGERGKIYRAETSADLAQWTLQSQQSGNGSVLSTTSQGPQGQPLFFRLGASDADSDGDGLSDWEELATNFNPARIYSEGLGSTSLSSPVTDKQRLASALAAASNTITVSAADPAMSENWPDPGRFVIRRTGNLDKVTIHFGLTGTAVPGLDYATPAASATIPFGADEISVEIVPLPDSEVESPESVTITLAPDAAYILGASTATLSLADSSSGKPSAKAAGRFLAQATFGPAPEELGRVMDLGYGGWIEEQFLREPNFHLPIVQAWQAELMPADNGAEVGTEHRIEAWWRQSMRADSASDPLRQRTAFALSQIFVISDRMSSLANDQRGMTSYYDTLLTHAFGNYRELLEAVTRHPWMGLYLSAMKNRKANPSINRFPDENYAREVLQLFSTGLWLLNPDGSQYLSNGSDLGPDGETIPAGQAVPTYGQSQISEIARVFTGMSYGMRFTTLTDPAEIPTTKFYDSQNIPWHPMRMFDGEHDLDAKTISFPGMPPLVMPARTGTTTTSQTGGDADLTAFLDHLANHPSVPPFICHRLIQRLVTSNPTPAYIGRVSAAFIDNGSGVRGDMKAVIRAILLDPEARDFSQLANPNHGLVREPYTRYIAMARALEAAPADPSAGGRYRGFSGLDGDFLQRPLSAPSVFNFYSPENKPPGPLRDAGLSSPEMQIINGVTSITGPNRYSSALRVTSTTLNADSPPTNGGWTQLNTTTQNEALWNTRINEGKWLDLATTDPAALGPDAMVAELDAILCYGNMSQPTFRAITRALQRLSDPFATADPLVRDQRIRARLRVAIHLVTTSADYAVLK